MRDRKRGMALFGCLAVASIMAAMPSVAAKAKIGGVVVQWGEAEVVAASPSDSAIEPNMLAPVHPLRSLRFVNHDDHIPAQLCRAFGVDVWLTRGPGEGFPSSVLLRLRHPRLTRPDGVSAAEQSYLATVVNGTLENSYSFDQPWEVQPGDWSFDFIIGGDVVASKTFTVTPRAPGSPASACEGGPVS